MDSKTSEQLEKILAMADSSHDGEAILAVRKARQLLAQSNLSFSDLARAASRARFPSPFALFNGSHAQLESQVIQLRQQLQDAEADLHILNAQLEFWRRRAMELEQNFNLSQSQTQHWRHLAQGTVEKLWDLGQQIGREEFESGQAAAPENQPLKAIAGGK